jgi:Circularly permutated YpsA SLOG family
VHCFDVSYVRDIRRATGVQKSPVPIDCGGHRLDWTLTQPTQSLTMAMTHSTRLTHSVSSGGQTGVDRAVPILQGGWCPPGRVAEDGVIPAHYGLCEITRDRRPSTPNVSFTADGMNSDATSPLYYCIVLAIHTIQEQRPHALFVSTTVIPYWTTTSSVPLVMQKRHSKLACQTRRKDPQRCRS